LAFYASPDVDIYNTVYRIKGDANREFVAHGRIDRRRQPAGLAALALAMTAAPALAAVPGQSARAPDEAAETTAILKVIADMQTAWNRGDFPGYMAGFLNPGVVFVSKGRFQNGWQGTLDHYIRDYGASVDTRGRVRFYDIRVEILGPDAAQLISRYELNRPKQAQRGINTRLMRKVDGRWVIALNHVSAEEVPSPA
jgi:uncharacterized protein (TIGR02246 family)